MRLRTFWEGKRVRIHGVMLLHCRWRSPMPSAKRAASSARCVNRVQWNALPTLGCLQHSGASEFRRACRLVIQNPLERFVLPLDCFRRCLVRLWRQDCWQWTASWAW
jgi:hypothetical protein